jgi:hypothetical protein|tara:strand:- start:164 stop:706 length:543 start_codon:yes stop_codon:yes gene_type:complete
MKNKIITILSSLVFSIAMTANESPAVIGGVEMASGEKSVAFEQVRKKLGKWEGTMTQGATGAVFDVSYEFKLTSGGNTITETLVEDGVEMLTTYSDDNGELVVRHYCGLGTEPVFSVSNLSDKAMSIKLDNSKADLHADHESFVTGMKWTMNSQDSITFENTVMLDGELTSNIAQIKRVY